MNKNEYGIAFNLNVNFNLSAAISLSMEIIRPDNTIITGVPTVGAAPLVTEFGTFLAQQYATYVFVSGDINQSGTYSARLTYNASGPTRLISDVVTFTVNP